MRGSGGVVRYIWAASPGVFLCVCLLCSSCPRWEHVRRSLHFAGGTMHLANLDASMGVVRFSSIKATSFPNDSRRFLLVLLTSARPSSLPSLPLPSLAATTAAIRSWSFFPDVLGPGCFTPRCWVNLYPLCLRRVVLLPRSRSIDTTFALAE